ncbi:MAG: phosphatidylserine/phosphatidylglycerophosphate/cardiolipin synthase family protein, partial [Alphaproteobacteria bacterium]|nr:phosphatidylserine/phosphatidylglycerophosphate/cardiolipin synthase family protein [Alphaproteobacteria bacterium]
MSQTQAEPLAGAAPHIPFPAIGSDPVRAGNHVRPLVDGQAAFRRICAAIEGAQHSVWLTVAFLAPDFEMPDGRGSLFDVLDRAVARHLDVRVIFWRHNAESAGYGLTFSGTPAERAALRARASRIQMRWDRAHDAYCQHQKMWLIDAGQRHETAFVGGMNLRPAYLASPGHAGGRIHDVYVEVAGPAASDVHHNFAQRWNEASERLGDDGVWAHDGGETMAFPVRLSGTRGRSLVQIQRTVHAGRYTDGRPSPDGQPFDIAGGEQSILAQYLQAIDAARRTIYIENQAIPIPAVAARIEAALTRGVEVVVLVPADPEERVRRARRQPENQSGFAHLVALGRHAHFALAGIAAPDGRSGRADVYVHSKMMLIDDAWATIG